ncbi:LPS export ABC transporter periplasmic protein LptC [Azospira restricta]|uniref:LPS export ABC transporter periplasmic protein LptC n=1 Tax=Azospira restricta TaxID=404405 RepID=A0A974SRJ7_9RHOO|nr:LPS export ABC transporter periplasmic protein LptC [Azospira restricta]QRJ65200.1 LPS export ABC transporter periplasmic protein LptC [Azospira restricta]
MKTWSSAAFPLAVLTVLAGLTFWLVRATAFPDERNDGKDRHDPDYIISGMEIRKLTRDGELQYILKATEARHFPDDDATEIALPHLTYLNPKKPTMYLSAQRAHVSADGETVQLNDDVRVKRDPTPTRAALFGTMPDLTVQTEEETAYTASPVTFTQGASWLKGVGMHLDNKTQTYILESQATGQFESRKAKAKP